MPTITINLTKREMAAVLRSEGLTAGHGVRKSIDLRSAQMKIIGAVYDAHLTTKEKP